MSERASAKFAALSAKFFFFLPSLWRVCQVWYKLYRVSAKFLACLPSLLAPSWQKIANSEPLSTKSTNSIVSVCNNFELAIFCQLVRVGRKHKTWQKGQELGRSETRKQKRGKPLVPRGTKEFIPPPPPARARQLRFPQPQ